MNFEANRGTLGRIAAFILIVITVAVVFQMLASSYLSQRNVIAIFRQMSINGIVSIGLTFVILLGRFDLSLAGVASFSAMSLGFVLANTANLPMSVIGAIGIGALCGAVSGTLIGRFRLPDVVTTIAIGSIAYGLGFVYSGGKKFSQNFFSSGILDFNDGFVLFIPLPAAFMLVTAAVAFYILHLSRYGQSFYAAGENELSAKLSGVPVKTYVAIAFTLCGALVGMAMVLNVAAIGASYVNTGNRILLPSYTAVYLGSAVFGRTTIPASLSGAFLMAMLLNGFTIISVPYYYSDAIISAILIIAIAAFRPQTFKWLARSFQFVGTSTVGERT